jgi:hypothetical protein
MTSQTNNSDARKEATKYWMLLSQLIALLDTGRYDDLDVEDVKKHARGGAISVLLGEVLQRGPASNIFTEDDWKSFNEEIARMANATNPLVVANKGIALLMSWALEGVQKRL